MVEDDIGQDIGDPGAQEVVDRHHRGVDLVVMGPGRYGTVLVEPFLAPQGIGRNSASPR